jgi:hypothetical protein
LPSRILNFHQNSNDHSITHFRPLKLTLQDSDGHQPDVIITRWCCRFEHNVTELFKFLSVMKCFQAMDVIKDLVQNILEILMKQLETSDDYIKKNELGRGGYVVVYRYKWMDTELAT